MKKRWKVFWILCAVIASLGILLTAAGMSLGGLVILRDVEENGFDGTWLDRILGRTVTALKEDTHLPDVEDSSASGGGYVAGEPDGETIHLYEDVRSLSLEVGGLGVCMLPYDGEDILVDASDIRADLRKYIVVSQDKTELDIELKNNKWNTNDSGMLYISIPSGAYYETVSADVGAGFLEMQDLKAEEVSLNVGAGQIITEDITAETVEAYCGAGQITLSGDVGNAADIECALGEVLFTLTGTSDLYNYELACGVGELIFDGEAYSGLTNTVNTDNGSSRTISADCAIGRIEISFEQK